MALMDVLVNRVLDEIRPMLTPDGGDVALVSCDDGVVKVEYRKGHNDACVDCVMAPEEFRAYLTDLLQERVQGVSDVEVLEKAVEGSDT